MKGSSPKFLNVQVLLDPNGFDTFRQQVASGFSIDFSFDMYNRFGQLVTETDFLFLRGKECIHVCPKGILHLLTYRLHFKF
jgi:hypothetical protein